MRRKKDYQKKGFRNPYFGQRKAKKPKRRYFFVLFILIIFGFYFLNTAERFKIKNIEISGNERIATEDINGRVLEQLKSRRFWLFNQNSIFFFSKKDLVNSMEGEYFIEELKIKKKYFDTLLVSVREKTSGIVWVSDNKQYYLDMEGVARREIKPEDLVIESLDENTNIIRPEAASGNYPLIKDQGNEPVILGEPATTKDTVNFVAILNKELNSATDIDVSYYFVPRAYSGEVTLVTKEGWEARFKATEEPRSQAALLASVLEQEVGSRASLEYIDLRFGEKVFYK